MFSLHHVQVKYVAIGIDDIPSRILQLCADAHAPAQTTS